MNEEVFRLDVSVDHILAMAVLDGLEQLIDVLADKDFIYAVGVLLEDLEQVLFEILKDQIQAVAPENDNHEGQCELDGQGKNIQHDVKTRIRP